MRVGRIFVCQPRHTGGLSGSHRVFFTSSSKKYGDRLTLCDHNCSLLAYGFNHLWCQALNLQQDGEDLTHFAMMHDDIVPESGWIDKLAEDMEKYDADVVSAVVPIKEMTGCTSTAIDDPTNPFVVERRIVMEEIHRLPEVFSAADCGYPTRKLLVNTGCWLCRLDRDWRFKVCFTIRDRIIRDNQGKFVPQTDPEDWNFSRQVQELGGRVLASRRVVLDHHGSLPYSNTHPWGFWDHDRNLGYKFGHRPIKGTVETSTPVASSMPDVEGKLTDEEGEFLSKLATDKKVLDITPGFGRTTIWLSKAAMAVHSVGRFYGPECNGKEGKKIFEENLKRHGIDEKVEVHTGSPEDLLPRIEVEFDLAVLGKEDYESVLSNVRSCVPMLREGALLCFVGYDPSSQSGTTLVVNALLARGAQLYETRGSLAIVCLHHDRERCPTCGWPMATERGQGCFPDDCQETYAKRNALIGV